LQEVDRVKSAQRLGLQQNGERPADVGIAGDLLKQLEESNTTVMKQKVADDVLAQFGFK